MFDALHVWLAIAALLVLASALTGDFTLIALALAAGAGAAVAAFTGFDALVQVGAAAVAAAILGPILHRFLRPLLRGANYGVTGSGAEIGGTVTVVQSGERLGVKIKHDFFPARAGSGRPLVVGETVVIRRIEGITAIVETPVEPPESDQPADSPGNNTHS